MKAPVMVGVADLEPYCRVARMEGVGRCRDARDGDADRECRRASGHVAHAQAGRRETVGGDPAAGRLGGVVDDAERRSGTPYVATVPYKRDGLRTVRC